MSGYFLYRAAVVRYIDRLFYEEGNRQRCHSRCHKLLIRQLCGIGDNTYWNYRHLPEPIVAEYALRPDIKMLLRLQVLLKFCRRLLCNKFLRNSVCSLQMLSKRPKKKIRRFRRRLSSCGFNPG